VTDGFGIYTTASIVFLVLNPVGITLKAFLQVDDKTLVFEDPVCRKKNIRFG
jgi:hypothetical protein